MSIQFTLEMFRHCCCGAVEVLETPEGAEFHRFTPEQRDTYLNSSDFWQKTFGCAGINLRFITNATKLTMHWHAGRGSSRKFVYFDCFVDGVCLKHDGVENYEETPDGVLELDLPHHRCEVKIVFPNLAKINVKNLELSGDCHVEYLPSRAKMLVFGDSITQGYDARYPSQSYIFQIAEKLGLELVNKAIGGDRFKPELLDCQEPFVPALIAVAYGTNDWNRSSREVFQNSASLFLKKLTARYPGVPVALLLPIWRADADRITEAGSFEDMRNFLRQCAAQYPQIQVIQGEIPHDTKLFSDSRLHPDDLGNILLFNSIAQQLKFPLTCRK